MNETKILLLCSSRFALPVMRTLLFGKCLTGVVIPEHCTDFIQEVNQLLLSSATPVMTVDKTNLADVLTDAVTRYRIDCCIMATFSFKIPAGVYHLPPKGFFNFHPGPLPQYRGMDPIFQQIKNREKQVGVTLHLVDDHFDTGPVVMTEMIPLPVDDTYGIVTTKLAEVAAKQMGILLQIIGFGGLVPSKKQDESKAVYYKKQDAADISINWQTMDADTIVALSNASNPWNKGAVTKINNTIIRLLEVEKVPQSDEVVQLPGTILAFENKTMIVATLNNEKVIIRIACMEEGFLTADRISKSGIRAGDKFENCL